MRLKRPARFFCLAIESRHWSLATSLQPTTSSLYFSLPESRHARHHEHSRGIGSAGAREGVLTLLVGPAVALLPKRWRKRFVLTPDEWKLAGSISGFIESMAALAASVTWYSYSVTHWAKDAIFSTVEAHPLAAIPPGTEGFAALVLLLFHRLLGSSFTAVSRAPFAFWRRPLAEQHSASSRSIWQNAATRFCWRAEVS